MAMVKVYSAGSLLLTLTGRSFHLLLIPLLFPEDADDSEPLPVSTSADGEAEGNNSSPKSESKITSPPQSEAKGSCIHLLLIFET